MARTRKQSLGTAVRNLLKELPDGTMFLHATVPPFQTVDESVESVENFERHAQWIQSMKIIVALAQQGLIVTVGLADVRKSLRQRQAIEKAARAFKVAKEAHDKEVVIDGADYLDRIGHTGLLMQKAGETLCYVLDQLDEE